LDKIQRYILFPNFHTASYTSPFLAIVMVSDRLSQLASQASDQVIMRDKLHNAIIYLNSSLGIHSAPVEKSFVPLGCLEEVCRRPNVESELLRALPDLEKGTVGLEESVEYVVAKDGRSGPGIIIWAILAYINCLEYFPRFVEARKDIDDKALPFLRQPKNLFEKFSKDAGIVDYCRDNFYTHQWLFLSPFIKEHVVGGNTQRFVSSIVMPWTSKKSLSTTKDGGNSRVYCVTIHEAHHDNVGFSKPPSISVPLKFILMDISSLSEKLTSS
jgi:hypothetical protein